MSGPAAGGPSSGPAHKAGGAAGPGGGRPSRLVGVFQLGDEIGKGGFGTVFKGLNTETGEVVAVKRISLQGLDEYEINSMKSEISLLKKLNHRNIVTYKDTIIADNYMHIILEFVENGSLSSTIKKFGAFSETLAAIYIAQVLEGLEYLHEQGVIHRDIKGANILTTKDGLVKLADFGVAVTDAEKSNSVVGSPYWMAPEIIEMAGPSTACDIWSLGCTVVELIAGNPPYFELRPMAALFRIVQDDSPPLPDHLSSAARDFLMECFRKEPSFRKSAPELLQHPWITGAVKRPKMAVPLAAAPVAAVITESERQDYEVSVAQTIRVTRDRAEAWGAEVHGKPTPGAASAAAGSKAAPPPRAQPAPAAGAKAGAKVVPPPVLPPDDDDDDDWGDIETTPLPAAPARQLPNADLVAAAFLESELSPAPQSTTSSRFSDRLAAFGADDDEEFGSGLDLTGGFSAPKAAAAGAADVFGDAFDDFDDAPVPVKVTRAAPAAKVELSRFQDDAGSDDDWGEVAVDASALQRARVSGGGTSNAAVGSAVAVARATAGLQPGRPAQISLEQLDVASALRARLALQNSSQPAGPVAFDDDAFEDDHEQPDMDRDMLKRQEREASRLADRIAVDQPADVIISACNQLVTMLRTRAPLRRYVVANHGIQPMVELLSSAGVSTGVQCAVLRVVNQIISGDTRLQEALSLLGVLPAVVRFATPTFSPFVRVQAAIFIQQLCSSSHITLLMIVACGGLKVLVDLLQRPPKGSWSADAPAEEAVYSVSEELGRLGFAVADVAAFFRHVALNGIGDIFRIESLPKSECCRHLMKAQFFTCLADVLRTMLRTVGDSGDVIMHSGQALSPELDMCLKDLVLATDLASIICSQTDSLVRSALAEQDVLMVMMRVLRPFPAPLLNHPRYLPAASRILRAIKALSMEPAALDRLQRAGAMHTLVPLLAQDRDPAGKELVSHAVHALFYLCRLSRPRQQAACEAGIIPLLQPLITRKSPLRQLALPILCDMAHNVKTKRVRTQLWKCNMVDTYLSLLGENYWAVHALNSLSVWLQHDMTAVQSVLLRPSSLMTLIHLMQSAERREFESLTAPLLAMLSKCSALASALAQSGLFMSELIHRLALNKAVVLKTLLSMLGCLYEAHPHRSQLLMQCKLYPVVSKLTEANFVLVRELATSLVRMFNADLMTMPTK